MLRCYFIEVQINICAIHQFNVFSFTTKSVAIYIMNIQEAKAIPLADYLQCLGYSPVKRQGCNLWYKSPLRTESEPSFKVNTELNRWFDFGLGKGGNIIDLAEQLYQENHLPSLLERIGRQAHNVRPMPTLSRQQPTAPSFQRLEIKELAHPALLRYLQERGIDAAITRNECRELHFTHNGKPYFAIGFPNVAGGYEVRNPFFKACIAPKEITHIQKGNGRNYVCYLFEGFMDYLSFLTIYKRNKPHSPDLTDKDCIILNSVSNIGKAMSRLDGYGRIHCFFDNDTAGRTAYREMEQAFPCKVRDTSTYYSEYKDLNDYLCGRKSVQETECSQTNKSTADSERTRQVHSAGRKIGRGFKP